MYTPKIVRWDERYASGDAQVDFQHKYMFETFNRLGEMIASGADEKSLRFILGRLRFYAEWHFLHEEECMYRHQCPAAGAKKQAHGFFLKMLDGYLTDMQNVERLPELAAIVHLDLLNWMETHILNVDGQLRGCIGQTGQKMDDRVDP